jgi:hypothetical protein
MTSGCSVSSLTGRGNQYSRPWLADQPDLVRENEGALDRRAMTCPRVGIIPERPARWGRR